MRKKISNFYALAAIILLVLLAFKGVSFGNLFFCALGLLGFVPLMGRVIFGRAR